MVVEVRGMACRQWLALGFACIGLPAIACSSSEFSSRVGDGGQSLGGSAGASTGGSAANTGGSSHAGGSANTGGSNGGAPATGGGAGVAGSAGQSTGGGSGTADGSVGCTYDGTHYGPGDGFPSTDGCNTCSCGAGGQVACTKRACMPDGGAGDARTCSDTRAGRICVRGTSASSGEVLGVGDELQVYVYPYGCFSSSCTSVEVSSCSVSGDTNFDVNAHFCLGSNAVPGGGCTADCNGGGWAECKSTATLTAGQHTVTLGGASVTFTVPSTLPFGGECDGEQF